MNIILIGQSGFPFGMATIQKMTSIAEGLVACGNDVCFINRLPTLNKKFHPDMQAEGIINGVHYIYVTGSAYRKSSFIFRNIQKIKSIFDEFIYIYKLNRKKKVNIAIVYETNIIRLCWYFILSRMFSYYQIFHYVEFRSKILVRTGLLHLNDIIFDRVAFYFIDGILPISQFLADHANNLRSTLPQMIVPPLTNFNDFDRVEKRDRGFLLFCGSVDYYEIIEFIILAFENVIAPEITLTLVVNGSKGNYAKLLHRIVGSPKQGLIQIKSNLSRVELISLYSDSTALLIPLRDNVQDKARFPQKIAEYTAAKKPIITTGFGEINRYFSDGKSALVAEKYDHMLFAEKINQCVSNSKLAYEIGMNGYKVGKNNFDSHYFSIRLNIFLLKNFKIESDE